jgi:hypothetical protein
MRFDASPNSYRDAHGPLNALFQTLLAIVIDSYRNATGEVRAQALAQIYFFSKIAVNEHGIQG